MQRAQNQAWNLESFIDSLVIELDKARETLALKAVNKPLTYTVKDMGLDLQLFPTFDGDQVRFTTAQPGQAGASKLSIQLGSITDQQIRQTTQKPISKEDVSIEVIDDLDKDTKKTLRKMGVTSINDLQNMEQKNIDIEKVSNKKVSYKKLADVLQKSRRGNLPPTVNKVSLSASNGKPVLVIEGKNLKVDQKFQPVAVINNTLTEVMAANAKEIKVSVNRELLKNGQNELVVTLDPYAIFKLGIKTE